MPTFKTHAVFEVARSLKAFLNLEAGITRGEIPESGMMLAALRADAQAQELRQVRQQLANKDQQLAKQSQRLTRVSQQLTEREQENAKREQENAELRARFAVTNKGVEANEAHPENIVWIFGTGRTGSTWLSTMMGEMPGWRVWFEPRVGVFLDNPEARNPQGRHHIFAPEHKRTWLESVRNLVLEGAVARFPEAKMILIKEPGGSRGASLLLEALPESRMILLIRDPRDVVASWLDAVERGGWAEVHARAAGTPDVPVDERARRLADMWLKDVGSAKEAYEAHAGHKILIRYEDLRADALGTMRRIYSTLDFPFDEKELAHAVEKHAWENVPGERRGEGKFHRKATPGGWREDLTPKQVEIVEKISGPLLKEFYPD